MAKKQVKGWGLSPATRASGAALDAATKARVETKARDLVEKVLKPKHVKPPAEDESSNYLTDITLKWHGSTLFFVSTYACPSPNAISPSFEDRFARLKPAGRDRFDLDFMRHTGQWVPLYQGLTVDQCMKAICDDAWFVP